MTKHLPGKLLISNILLWCCISTVSAANDQPTAVPDVAPGQILEAGPETPAPNVTPKPTLDPETQKKWEDLTPEQRQKIHKQLDRGWRFLPAGVYTGTREEYEADIKKFSKFRLYEDLSPEEQKKADEDFRQMWNSFTPEQRQKVLNFKVMF